MSPGESGSEFISVGVVESSGVVSRVVDWRVLHLGHACLLCFFLRLVLVPAYCVALISDRRFRAQQRNSSLFVSIFIFTEQILLNVEFYSQYFDVPMKMKMNYCFSTKP